MGPRAIRATGAAACVAAAVAALAVGAYRRHGAPTRPDDALAAELERASAVASAVSVAGRTRFVSPLELGVDAAHGATATTHARAATTTRLAPTRSTRTRARSVVRLAARTHAPAPTAAAATVAVAPTEVADEAPAAATAAEPAPRPADVGRGPSAGDAPAPAEPTGSEGSDERRGGWGRVIGVVLRGAGVGDDDHCERDDPDTRRGRHRRRRGGDGAWPVGGLPGDIGVPLPRGGGASMPGLPRF